MTTTVQSAPSSKKSPPPNRSANGRRSRRVRMAGRYAILALMFVLLAGPLLWQLSLALKGAGDNIYEQPPQLLPSDPTLENFTAVIDQIPVMRFMLNSILVAAMVVIGNIVLCTMAGYALGRLRWKLRPVATAVFVVALLVPMEAVLIAQFLLVRSMNLTDTLLGVALPMIVAPLNVLLMRNAFKGLPDDLEEAAVIDGANVWQRFLRVCVPQVKGMISVVAIFSFVAAWNDFLWPLVVTSSESNFTLTVGLNYLRGSFYDNPSLIAAGTILAIIPIVIFFIALQRYLMKGLEQGGIKG